MSTPPPTEQNKKKRRMARLIEHMVGPFGSVVFHIAAVIGLIAFAGHSVVQQESDFEVVMVEADAVDLEVFQQEIEKVESFEELVDVEPPPDAVMTDVPQLPGEGIGDQGAGAGQGVGASSGLDSGLDVGALNVDSVQGALVMKGLYQGRSSGGRGQGLANYAGKYGQYTESAVIKALEWLKKKQAADGSWGPNKPAMTGLAILTFLAHGETTSSDKYGPTVEKGIRFLVSQQNEAGEFLDVKNNPGPYGHAIATYAISEAYGLTRIPSLKPVMEKAISVVVAGQQAKGGWNYAYDHGSRRDTSVAGWQVQALKSAYIAGSDNPGIKPALEKAIEDLKTVQDAATGEFYYSDMTSHHTDCITAIGVLCLQLIGHSKDKECKMGLDALRAADCDWGKPPPWSLYAWYYITQAKFHSGGPGWTAWNSKFAKEFTENQNEDGSWTSPSGALQDGKETNNGPVYSTALAALTLQVYYRFLPTYKPIAVESEEGASEDEIKIEVI
jgi:hypothetical protein